LTVLDDDPVPFTTTEVGSGITHPNNTDFVVGALGVYTVTFGAISTVSVPTKQLALSSFQIEKNGVAVPGGRIALVLGQASITASFPASAGDIITVRNVSLLSVVLGTLLDPASTAAYINIQQIQ
jgi:hypothetical protein